ncbi:uncharacterized protein ASCRUDRAFT_10858 [Ascoidea rubescens DSM 1968]|uniref:Uncharacterized protein n=1 Tax=Ascoidea rubescens DSM 1968 TaxID=1344418 RepID=A0A1D2VNZ8_9ASCO|nr:hypothetical protein ASCRUDRAFT_10858 [Ascoidea rubescens DSM 1968]ODV63341.1 hypothetical protein ASCRUDRAFT_10858 [Ascoidea rubescens DSM 1968]
MALTSSTTTNSNNKHAFDPFTTPDKVEKKVTPHPKSIRSIKSNKSSNSNEPINSLKPNVDLNKITKAAKNTKIKKSKKTLNQNYPNNNNAVEINNNNNQNVITFDELNTSMATIASSIAFSMTSSKSDRDPNYDIDVELPGNDTTLTSINDNVQVDKKVIMSKNTMKEEAEMDTKEIEENNNKTKNKIDKMENEKKTQQALKKKQKQKEKQKFISPDNEVTPSLQNLNLSNYDKLKIVGNELCNITNEFDHLDNVDHIKNSDIIDVKRNLLNDLQSLENSDNDNDINGKKNNDKNNSNNNYGNNKNQKENQDKNDNNKNNKNNNDINDNSDNGNDNSFDINIEEENSNINNLLKRNNILFEDFKTALKNSNKFIINTEKNNDPTDNELFELFKINQDKILNDYRKYNDDVMVNLLNSSIISKRSSLDKENNNYKNNKNEIENEIEIENGIENKNELIKFNWEKLGAVYDYIFEDYEKSMNEIIKNFEKLDKKRNNWIDSALFIDDQRATKRLQIQQNYIILKENYITHVKKNLIKSIKVISKVITSLNS